MLFSPPWHFEPHFHATCGANLRPLLALRTVNCDEYCRGTTTDMHRGQVEGVISGSLPVTQVQLLFTPNLLIA